MAAENWRGVVALDDEAEKKRDKEASLTPEMLGAELGAAVLLFEAFLASDDAKDAAKMYARFGGSLVIVELDHRERDQDDLFYDIFDARGLLRTQRKVGHEYADEVDARTPHDVVADWVSRWWYRRAYEFLPWLFAEFDAFADKHRVELQRTAKEKEEESKRKNKK